MNDQTYPCCVHCYAGCQSGVPHHETPCWKGCNGPLTHYVEEADANPERRDNGCQIYRSA